MSEMDSILTIVENPTRRRILQALVREPHYPLQLSHELGVSQQAIMKNLVLMQKMGLLESYHESSNMGPDRIFYRPTSEFSIVIDLRGNMFDVKMTTSGPAQLPEAPPERYREDAENLEDTRMRIASIDRQLTEFEKKRQELIRARGALIDKFMHDSKADMMDYHHRAMLYTMLNSPSWTAEDISRETGLSKAIVMMMIENLVEYCDGKDNGKEDLECQRATERSRLKR